MSGTTSSTTKTNFRADIEGLRALAILLVVGYHAGLPGFGGGYVGVDVFFVLSGYLITGILIKEAETKGKIDLGRFYARRARRLLPALGVVLVFTVLVGSFVYAPFEQRALANTAISTGSYLSNVYFAYTSTDYLGASQEINPLLHTWSLSVEEQFYLVWPLFVMSALGLFAGLQKKPNRRRLLWWMVAATFSSFALSLYLTHVRQPWAFFLSPARAWEFAAGAICVLIPIKISEESENDFEKCRFSTCILGWLGFAGILFSTATFNAETAFPGVAAVLPVLSTAAILRSGALSQDTSLLKILSWRPFQEVGRLSYSWYLWHWPVLVIATTVAPEISFFTKILLLFFSLALSEASFRLIENPLRYHPWLIRRTANSLAMALVLTLGCVGFGYAWKEISLVWAAQPNQVRFTQAWEDIPSMQENGCNLNFYETQIDIEKCISGKTAADRNIVLFGDSHALQWFPPLDIIAQKHGWKIMSFTKSSCAAVDQNFFLSALGREYKECETWRANTLEKIKSLNPDLVIVSNSYSYPFSREQWVRGIDDVVRKLSTSSKAVAIVRDTPRFFFDVPTLLAREEWGVTFMHKKVRVPKIDVHEIQKEISKRYENVFIIDMTADIFPDRYPEMKRGDVILYKDSNHLTATFTKSLALQLEAKMTYPYSSDFDLFNLGGRVSLDSRSEFLD